MSETIGQVNISLRMSLAKFQDDVKQGTDAARRGVKQMGEEIQSSTGEARGALALLGEETGVHLPRHIRSFVAELPGMGPALNAAFSTVAVVGLVVTITELIKKIGEYSESLGKMDKVQQKAFDDGIKGAKELLNYQLALIKGQYDLAESLAKGTDKDKLKVEAAKASLAAHQQELDTLKKQELALDQIIDKQRDAAARPVIRPGLYGGAQLVDFGAAKAQQQIEDVRKHIEDLTKTINLEQAALQTSQAATNNAATELHDHLAEAAKKAAEQSKKLADELYNVILKVSQLGVVSRKPINLGLPTAEDVDPNGIFKLAGILDKNLPQNKPPVYGGTKEAEQLYKIQHDQNAAVAEAQKVFTSTRTAAEQYANEIAVLNELLKQGKIDQDTYDRAKLEAQTRANTTGAAFKELGRDIGETINQAALFGRSWSDTFKSIGIEIAEMILKMTLLKTLTKEAAGGGISGFFASIASGLAGAGTGSAPGRASGGDVIAGHVYTVGETGRELFVPRQSGYIVPNAALRGSSGASGPNKTTIHVTQNITTPNADSFGRSQKQLLSQAFRQAGTAHAQSKGRF